MPSGDVAPFLITVLISLSIAAVLILRGPLGRALARRLEGPSGEARLQEDLEDLQARVSEGEALAARVAELEERMDFSERLLVQQPPPRELVERHDG